MPVDAIHMSAFLDSLAASDARRVIHSDDARNLGRLGALAIDLPYFDRFPVSLVRYLLHLPTATSAWGSDLHYGSPVAAAKTMLSRARELRSRSGTLSAGNRVLALALGFVSHLAVDGSLHPLVNRMARTRAARLGDDPARQHTEVEKFQSVLFHEERNGFDFMGQKALRAHIVLDAHVLHRDEALRDAYTQGIARTVGRTPSVHLLKRWAHGYAQYVWFVSSPLGRTLVPEHVKHEVRAEVYKGAWGSFHEAYNEAVNRSRIAMDLALALAESPLMSGVSEAEAAFDSAVPAGPIDSPTPA